VDSRSARHDLAPLRARDAVVPSKIAFPPRSSTRAPHPRQ
jgi:hypothetical protein